MGRPPTAWTKSQRCTAIEHYRHYLRQFASYLARIELKKIAHLSQTVLGGFVAEYGQRVARAGLRNACGVLRVFLRYLHREGVLKKDISRVIEYPPTFRLSGIPHSIGWDDVRRVLEMVDRRTPTGPGVPLTRFGINKIVRRYGKVLDSAGAHPRRVTPHLFRHTAAVHLLESGVEVNVIRGWLGHVSLDTTNRYAELTLRAKEAALRTCDAAFETSAALSRRSVWKDDESLLAWLESL
jgi:site-specific recombinase XerD